LPGSHLAQCVDDHQDLRTREEPGHKSCGLSCEAFETHVLPDLVQRRADPVAQGEDEAGQDALYEHRPRQHRGRQRNAGESQSHYQSDGGEREGETAEVGHGVIQPEASIPRQVTSAARDVVVQPSVRRIL